MTDTFTLPEKGDEDWDVPLNNALRYLDNNKTSVSTKGEPNGLATLGADGKLAQQIDWGNILNHPVTNVKAHGAKGDGSTDDHQAITAAIDATPAEGTLLFPPGLYGVSQPVRLKPHRSYVALGAPRSSLGARIIALNNINAVAASAGWLDDDANPDPWGLTISGLCFDGDDKAIYGLVTWCGGTFCEKVRTQNTQNHGIYVASTTQNHVAMSGSTHGEAYIDCFGADAGGDGFHAGETRMDSHLIRFRCGDVSSGIVLEKGTGWTVDSCHPFRCSQDLLHVTGAWTSRITNNYLDGLGWDSTGTTHYGLWVEGPGPAVITGNTIIDRPGYVSTDPCVGIHLGSSSTFDVICKDNTGLYFTDDADYTKLEASNIGATSVIIDNLFVSQPSGASGETAEKAGRATSDEGYTQGTTDTNGHLLIPHGLGVKASGMIATVTDADANQQQSVAWAPGYSGSQNNAVVCRDETGAIQSGVTVNVVWRCWA